MTAGPGPARSLGLALLALLVGSVSAGCPGGHPTRPIPLFRFDEGLSGVRGVWHPVAAGESLASIAARYEAEVEDIVEINDLRGEPEVGREIFVLTDRMGPEAATGATLSGGADDTPRTLALPPAVGCLSWPVDGGIVTSGFGIRRGKNHDGLDIAADRGKPVRASAAGEVIYAASKLRGYGNMVVVRHAGGLATVYAHNRVNLVEEGERVVRGQVIAEVGATGRATGPHVHFEVRFGESPRNPRRFLPPACEEETPRELPEDSSSSGS